MQDEPQTLLKLSGAMTIQTITEVQHLLLRDLDVHPAVLLDLAEINEVDLTFVQLIESARLWAAQEGKTLRLRAPAADLLLEALQRGGFIGDPTGAGTQFWLAH